MVSSGSSGGSPRINFAATNSHEATGSRMAIKIDNVVGHQQIYVKPIPELLSSLRLLAGLTILGDDLPIFLLDLNQLG